MKKQFLALIGGVMVAGLAMAAEVVGNNEAVVIQKDAVKSSTGFQFLCVPVAALNITGGNGGTLTLADVLPPDSYPAGTQVTPTDDSSLIYCVVEVDGENQWQDLDENDASNVTFAKGTIFWMQYDGEDALPATVFCGQANDLVEIPSGQGIVACGNTSSAAKTLKQLIPEPADGSVVYLIKADQTEYKTYRAYGKNWYDENSEGGRPSSANTVTIAAGEALYYHKK